MRYNQKHHTVVPGCKHGSDGGRKRRRSRAEVQQTPTQRSRRRQSRDERHSPQQHNVGGPPSQQLKRKWNSGGEGQL